MAPNKELFGQDVSQYGKRDSVSLFLIPPRQFINVEHKLFLDLDISCVKKYLHQHQKFDEVDFLDTPILLYQNLYNPLNERIERELLQDDQVP